MKKLLNILKDKEKLRELVVYGIFGVLTTIVSFGSFYILRKVFSNVSESILNTISIMLAILFAYLTNRKFVFKSKEKNIVGNGVTRWVQRKMIFPRDSAGTYSAVEGPSPPAKSTNTIYHIWRNSKKLEKYI